MAKEKRAEDTLDPRRVLTGRGPGQSRLRLAPEHIVYAQGDPADALFYVEGGWVKISVLAPSGKEAVVALRGEGEFFGMRSLAAQWRTTTVTSLTGCSLVRVTTSALTRMLREEPGFAEMFTTYLVRQHIRDVESLVDQLTNSAERRLARVLLQLANSGGDNATPISQAVLAKMIGTTRSRVSFFMNRFRRQGYIAYNRHGYAVRNSLTALLKG